MTEDTWPKARASWSRLLDAVAEFRASMLESKAVDHEAFALDLRLKARLILERRRKQKEGH